MRKLLLVPAVAGLVLARSTEAQVPAGSEFVVNAATTGSHERPAVGTDAKGNFLVAWASSRLGGPVADGIFTRRVAADGTLVGTDLRVNSDTLQRFATRPSVGVHPDGSFVVVWMEDTVDAGFEITGRRFDRDGVRRGEEFRANTYTTGDQVDPEVRVTPDGGFVVVWSGEKGNADDQEVVLQRFDAAGTQAGAEFQVNGYTTADQQNPRVAVGANGSFVIVWESYNGEYNLTKAMMARMFGPTGAPTSPEFEAISSLAEARDPAVAVKPDGSFVVVWEEPYPLGTAVGGRTFDPTGLPTGFVTISTTGTSNAYPRISAAENGAFAVAWLSFGTATPHSIHARRFDAFGNSPGAEVVVDDDPETRPLVLASDPVGNFMVVWQELERRGSYRDVVGRRYGGLLPAALDVDTSGNRIVEPGETVDVRPTWRNVNGAAQAFDGSAAGFDGPGDPTVSYSVLDASAEYGSVPDGATQPCTACYQARVTVSGPRPVLHWDAALEEWLTPDVLGQAKRWRVHLGASFADVPVASPFYRFVETLLHNGVTAGCGGAAFCPAGAATRQEMAAFVITAREGARYRPPPCTTAVFADVPPASPFCPFVVELSRRGVVAGCGGSNYCPGNFVARDQMAVFVLATLDPTFTPPACGTPRFDDVPSSSPFCPWVEELARRGIASGCGATSYCPKVAVTRREMAIFLTLGFGLTLYGP